VTVDIGRNGARDRGRPLVSVVIPSYDRPAFVRRAVQCVLDQTYPNVECIVVDDHSPYPVEPMVADLPTHRLSGFHVLRHEENRGGNAARNTGIEAARGEFVAFLDDDDRWLPEKLEKQVAAFDRAGPEVGVVYTGAVVVDGDDEVVATYVRRARGDILPALVRGLTIRSFSRVLVRRDAIEAAGLPDERFPNWQDREWYIRLAAVSDFEPVPELLTVHTAADHVQITDGFEQKRDVALPLFLEKHRETAAVYGSIAERQFVSVLLWSTAWTGFTSGQRWDAVRMLLRSLRAWPLSTTAYFLLGLALAGPRVYRTLRELKGNRAVEKEGLHPEIERLPDLTTPPELEREPVATDGGNEDEGENED
jgi:glycosyltransferase involved in cell wall biosynthesis